ncbi:MAG: alkaline phosphatase [Chloroflexi bacterium]|nr:alkaline phosphatase [Chloroflexota bacterium]
MRRKPLGGIGRSPGVSLPPHRSSPNVLLSAFLLILLVAARPLGARAQEPAGPVASPRNVILMIADGCGYNHIVAHCLYQHGATADPILDSLPYRFALSTYPANGHGYDPTHWERHDFAYPALYPTDSAAAGTALATGFKTRNGIVGMHPDWTTVLVNTVERAESTGRSTGVVTSVYFADATPAAFVAHSGERDDYDLIAQHMLLASALDALMGGGHPLYDAAGQARAANYDLIGGESTWSALSAGTAGADADADGDADPWQLVETRAAFQALMTGDTPSRVCGIPQVARTLQQERPGNALAAPYVVPLLESVPSLREMALGALNVLDADRDGFFLMIEGGAVDWASHEHQTGRMLEEMADFWTTVAAVTDWVAAHSSWQETLLVVTADHETGYVWGPGSNPGWLDLHNNGAGAVPGLTWNADCHTNSLVPLFARGEGALALAALADEYDPVRGAYLDNAELGALLLELLAVPAPTYELVLPLIRRF